MLAFLFTSYELFVSSRVIPRGAADNLVVILFGAPKERCLFVHARLVYYVYIGKSRDFTRIYKKTVQPSDARRRIYACIKIRRLTLRWLKCFYSSNSGVEKYRSAVSGRTVTTVFPSPNFLASLIAAATFVPEEIPHMIPSFEASSRDV